MKKRIVITIILLGVLFSSISLHQKMINYSRYNNLLQSVTAEKSFPYPILLDFCFIY